MNCQPLTAYLNAHSLVHNVHALESRSPKGANMLAVVKANAYGHGIDLISKALEPHVFGFGVSSADEALMLRGFGTQKPIVTFSQRLIDGTLERLQQAAIESVLFTMEDVDAVLKHYRQPRLWLKVDVGMHRLGLDVSKVALVYNMLEKKLAKRGVKIVMMAHLSDALNPETTHAELGRFIEVLNQTQATHYSLCATGGVLSGCDEKILKACKHVQSFWTRPGYGLYGGILRSEDATSFRKVMNLQGSVITIRTLESGDCVGYGGLWCASKFGRIAIVNAGYADGIPYTHTDAHHGIVRIKGKEFPVVGSVCMDMLAVDVGESNVCIGDEVELWGENISVESIAKRTSTIGYQIFASLNQRVRRIFIKN